MDKSAPDQKATLDSCDHKYCFNCLKNNILKNGARCPICKAKFKNITRTKSDGQKETLKIDGRIAFGKDPICFLCFKKCPFPITSDGRFSRESVSCSICNDIIMSDCCLGCAMKGKFAHKSCLTLEKDHFGTIQDLGMKSRISAHWHCQDCQKNEPNPEEKCFICRDIKRAGFEGFMNFKRHGKVIKPKRLCVIKNENNQNQN